MLSALKTRLLSYYTILQISKDDTEQTVGQDVKNRTARYRMHIQQDSLLNINQRIACMTTVHDKPMTYAGYAGTGESNVYATHGPLDCYLRKDLRNDLS